MDFKHTLGQPFRTRLGNGWPNATRIEEQLRPALNVVARVRVLLISPRFKSFVLHDVSITASPNVTGKCCSG
jgi:hypothetical protein